MCRGGMYGGSLFFFFLKFNLKGVDAKGRDQYSAHIGQLDSTGAPVQAFDWTTLTNPLRLLVELVVNRSVLSDAG